MSLGAYSWAFSQADLTEMPPAMETAANIALNKASGDWDTGRLVTALESIKIEGLDINITGFNEKELVTFMADIGRNNIISPEVAKAKLTERFIVPPFTVLDTRQGYWQDRKRAWIALGIKSELGRGGGDPSGCNGSCHVISGG